MTSFNKCNTEGIKVYDIYIYILYMYSIHLQGIDDICPLTVNRQQIYNITQMLLLEIPETTEE